MVCIDLNCDLGEGLSNDALIMPFISSANIACGFHAGDKETMARTATLALQHQVMIGAHPGFKDKENFGRKELFLSPLEVYDLVTTQIQALQDICARLQTRLHHVKPHGALYNMAARDAVLANAVAKAVKDADPFLVVYGLSGSKLVTASKKLQLKTASEVFADRAYLDDGSLANRNEPNALIENVQQAINQALQMIQQHKVSSLSGKLVTIRAETLCLHGDGLYAVDFAKKINEAMRKLTVDK